MYSALGCSLSPDQIKKFQDLIKIVPCDHEINASNEVPRAKRIYIPYSPYEVTLKVKSKYYDTYPTQSVGLKPAQASVQLDLRSSLIASVELKVCRFVSYGCHHMEACYNCTHPGETASFKTNLKIFIDEQFSYLIGCTTDTYVYTVYDHLKNDKRFRELREFIEEEHRNAMKPVASYIEEEFVPRVMKSIGFPIKLETADLDTTS